MIGPAHVLTYGDLMLDVLITGSCNRMSPEAPHAPVLLLEEADGAPGGAANVAVNVASMGGSSSLVGSIGKDASGAILTTMLHAAHVECELIPRAVPTITKARFVSDGQQMMRMDMEIVEPLKEAEEERVLACLLERLPKVGAVVLSDYAKGAVTPRIAGKLIVAATVQGVPVIVDSKTPAAKHWQGAALIKPNLIEIAAALDQPEPQTDGEAAACAQTLRRRINAAFVVLTRGAQGLCIAGEPGAMHIAGHAVNPVDVTGAGDAVAAGLALALASGESIIDAARFANAAGAAAVSKMGTAALTFDEINFFYDCDAAGRHRAGAGVAGERPSHRLH